MDSGRWREDLRGLRLHDLRHSYASTLVSLGIQPKLMAKALGHASAQLSLDRYSHLNDGALAALAEQLDEAYCKSG